MFEEYNRKMVEAGNGEVDLVGAFTHADPDKTCFFRIDNIEHFVVVYIFLEKAQKHFHPLLFLLCIHRNPSIFYNEYPIGIIDISSINYYIEN